MRRSNQTCSRSTRHIARWTLAGLVALGSIGCSKRPNLAPVSGTVTLDGAPVADAAVMFHPTAGGPIATATTDAHGRFTLVTTNTPGALVGEHQVAIAKSEMHNIVDGVPGPGGEVMQWFTPPHYANKATSGLTAEVPRSGAENLAFSLLTPL